MLFKEGIPLKKWISQLHWKLLMEFECHQIERKPIPKDLVQWCIFKNTNLIYIVRSLNNFTAQKLRMMGVNWNCVWQAGGGLARGRILNVDVIQPDAAFIPNILTVQRYIGYQTFLLFRDAWDTKHLDCSEIHRIPNIFNAQNHWYTKPLGIKWEERNEEQDRGLLWCAPA